MYNIENIIYDVRFFHIDEIVKNLGVHVTSGMIWLYSMHVVWCGAFRKLCALLYYYYEFLLPKSAFIWTRALMPVCMNMKALTECELNKLYEVWHNMQASYTAGWVTTKPKKWTAPAQIAAKLSLRWMILTL